MRIMGNHESKRKNMNIMDKPWKHWKAIEKKWAPIKHEGPQPLGKFKEGHHCDRWTWGKCSISSRSTLIFWKRPICLPKMYSRSSVTPKGCRGWGFHFYCCCIYIYIYILCIYIYIYCIYIYTYIVYIYIHHQGQCGKFRHRQALQDSSLGPFCNRNKTYHLVI